MKVCGTHRLAARAGLALVALDAGRPRHAGRARRPRRPRRPHHLCGQLRSTNAYYIIYTFVKNV